MDDQQQQIFDDLSGVFEGELRFDTVARELYSTDGSLFQIRPLGVAFPRHREDVVALTRYASEFGLPLIPRGAGSGIAGGALGRGLIVDFSRHFRDIKHIAGDTVTVQVGVVRDTLNRALQSHGRYFAPDPSNSMVTTVGGMLAVDGAGSHAVRFGSTRDNVQQIEAVLADGTIIEAGDYPSPFKIGGQDRLAEIIHQLGHLLTRNEDLIRERQPSMLRNCAGYHLRSLLRDGNLNLPRLLVGSEGTLALFTEAKLYTVPIAAHRAVTLLLFADLQKAIEAAKSITELQPSACDLLDRRLLSLAREADERFSILIPRNAEAGLLVEQIGYSDRQVRDRLSSLVMAAKESDSSVLVAAEAFNYDDVEFLWSLPYRVVPLLNRLRGETRPVPIVEDIAVPPQVLDEFLVKAQRVFQRHWITASLYSHVATGQVHFRPFLSQATPENANKIEALARELYEVAFACGGTISGEHGDGISRTAFIRSQYGPLYRVFQRIKEIFDPHNLLNPGKIVNDDPHYTIRHFRPVPPAVNTSEQTELVPLNLNWQHAELSEVAHRCNGCGTCRATVPELRMCPFFHEAPVEWNSPRSKANLFRGLTNGSIQTRTFSTEEARQLSESCFNCKQCQIECPANVDIPSIAIEAKAQVVSAEGLSRADWILSRAHSFGRLGSAIAPLANWALGNAGIRWLIEKTLGIARERRVPAFSRRTLLDALPKSLQQATSDPQLIVYFVDHYANFHDPDLGLAFLQILKHHEIPVVVPPKQVASGMAMISAGDLDAARELAETNIQVLAEYAREGRRIVCTEPTAAVCLKYEYPRLVEHPDVHMLADQVTDAGTFLLEQHQAGKLKTDFDHISMKLAYHLPCHVRFLSQTSPFLKLLNLIPGVDIEELRKECSGMAGAFGMTARNFDQSLRMGQQLISEMQRPELDAGLTECSSCQIQMRQQTATPTLHPLKLLAWAYGLTPEVATRSNTPQRRPLRPVLY